MQLDYSRSLKCQSNDIVEYLLDLKRNCLLHSGQMVEMINRCDMEYVAGVYF